MIIQNGSRRPGRISLPVWSCLAVLALFGTGCLPSGLRLPENPLLRTLERKSGLIAYLGTDGNMYTVDQGGGNQKALTDDAQGFDGQGEFRHFYQFPAWSPRERRIAFVGFDFRGNSLEGVQLYVASADGQELLETFRSEDQFPFYLYWSPDGKNISFLTSGTASDQLSFHLIPARGGPAQVLGSGSPFYMAWSPDNRSILVHTGRDVSDSRLAFLNLEDPVREEELSLFPGPFQSPAWSPDGDELLLVGKTELDGQDELLLLNRQGEVKKALAKTDGPIAFDWSPDGERLAYLAIPSTPSESSNRELVVLDPDNPEESKRAVEDFLVGFFWSPDSRKLAYFKPVVVAPQEEGGAQASPQLYLELHVMDVRSGDSQDVASFRPTENFANLLPNFDQYQRSVTIWSPDSRNLVISAIDNDNEPGIFVVEASANLTPRYITPGLLAFWSWK